MLIFRGRATNQTEEAVLVIRSVGKTADHPAGSESDSKFGIKQENRFKFLDQRPFKKEVVVDLDSDSGIEEITEKSSDSGLASGC